MLRAAAFGVSLASMASAAGGALAQKAPPVTIIVGTSTGGLYDLTARLWSRHLGRFLPGDPTIIVQNMPGAGSLTAVNYLYNIAPKDGTTLGVINASSVLQALFQDPKAKFDARKLAWIGGRSQETAVCGFWHTAKPKSFDDLRKMESIVGSSGPGASSYTHPLMLNALLGTKMRMISGYPGGSEMSLAMQRGEIEGECGWSWGSMKTRTAQWLRDGKIKVLLQAGLKKNPDLPNVPSALDYVKDDEARGIMKAVLTGTLLAWPLVAPPGLGDAKVAQLRGAFQAMMKDPEMLKDAEKGKLEIDPVSGEEMQDIVQGLYELPPALIAKTKSILQ
jgi:tripartite-type tricarboxylate transporter receptor subunit TctC